MKKYGVWVFAGLMWGVVLVLERDRPQRLLPLVLLVAGAYVGLLGAIVVHELGHLVAVWAVRWKAITIQVFGFNASLIDGKWRIAWVWKPAHAAYVRFLPAGRSVAAGATVLVAGAAADVLLAGLFVWLAVLAEGAFVVGWSLAAAMAALTAVFSLWPATMKNGYLSDGSRLLHFMFQRKDFSAWLAAAETAGAAYGLRSREVPASALAIVGCGARRAMARYLRYGAELDSGNVLAAMVELKEAWNLRESLNVNPAMRAVVGYTVALFFRRYVDDPELADAGEADGKVATKWCPTSKWADAAKAYAAGDRSAAEAAVREAGAMNLAYGPVSEAAKAEGMDAVRRFFDPAVPRLSREEADATVARGDYPRMCEPALAVSEAS